jgi:hypothetical protein
MIASSIIKTDGEPIDGSLSVDYIEIVRSVQSEADYFFISTIIAYVTINITAKTASIRASLLSLVFQRNKSVADLLSRNTLVVGFRRLPPIRLNGAKI